MISDTKRDKMVVGLKQVLKALSEDRAIKVYLADDCDLSISSNVCSKAESGNVELLHVPTMKDLGSLCQIEVSASCAAECK